MTTFPLGEADYYSILAKDSMFFYNTTYNVKQFMGTTNNLIEGHPNYKIPFAPIINGAAASQAQKDVADTITLINGLQHSSTYKGKLVNVITIINNIDLNIILTNNSPTPNIINIYKINGNLTMSIPTTQIDIGASTVCIFIANNIISISTSPITITHILPTNLIFISLANIEIERNISGIYIANNELKVTGSNITGRIISQNNRVIVNGATITPP